MTGGQLISGLAGALTGYLTARVWITPVVQNAPPSLVRTNVRGLRVPAVLGLPLAIGGIAGAGVVYLIDRTTALAITTTETVLAVVVIVVVSALAGYADDRRGDEPARGFTGHLRAGLAGSVTGGLIKIVGVGLAGVAAGLLTGSGWYVLECAVLVALTANLVNLLDRAPGRAAKFSLLIAVPLLILGADVWAVAAAGVVGGLLACLADDLGERAMLGDAGANPLGALLGLGLAVSLDRPVRLAVIGALLALNLVSERWSFSKGIEKVGLLRSLDRWGREN